MRQRGLVRGVRPQRRHRYRWPVTFVLCGTAPLNLVDELGCLVFFAAAAPSSLYRVYQAQFRFSAATLTAVFAVYVLVLLVTLLFFGSV